MNNIGIINSIIFPDLVSSGQAQRLAGRLEGLKKELYTSTNWNELAEKWLTVDELNALKMWIEKRQVDTSRTAELDAILKYLIQNLSQLPTIKLTVAGELSTKFVKEIHRRCMQVLNSTVLLEVKIDQKIIGGVICEFRGKIKDYSLQKRLDELMARELAEAGN